METKFNVFEIFQIAEKIERNGAKFYLRAAELFDDSERRDIFYKLANWKARHEKALAKRRKLFSEKTGQFGTFDPDNYVLSNPHVLVGLAAFTAKPSFRDHMSGHEGKKEIFRTAVRMSKQAIVFYEGLKDFSRDPASRDTIDQIVEEEKKHISILMEAMEEK
ncbi:MAG: ferritin family protein [Sedimentisphaerales bacterium]|nr:ferritin family protein [Sedimentisphaerales bacterium]